MEITRYMVQEKKLTPWIKFFWRLKTSEHTVSQKLLPTESIDMLINLGDKIDYEVESACISAPKIHVNGLRNQYSFIRQTGNIHIYGISFYPYGLYPFVRQPMTKIKDKIVDLHELSKKLTYELEQIANDCTFVQLETILLNALKVDGDYINKSKLLSDFIMVDDRITLKVFCEMQDINIKTFERFCVRCAGYSPVTLRRIHRFQIASNQIVHQNPNNLADVAYNNSFADQSHLNREFRAFAGESPRTFTRNKSSIKENAKYKYE